jgi:hypothetical protein
LASRCHQAELHFPKLQESRKPEGMKAKSLEAAIKGAGPRVLLEGTQIWYRQAIQFSALKPEYAR